MEIRDRIKELRRVRAGDLKPHPKNWRSHPESQRNALRGLLAEIGYADTLLTRELPDGCLQTIDGHLRAETTPDSLVPVLVTDLTEEEAEKVLLTLDPLAALATAEKPKLEALLREVSSPDGAVQKMLADLASKHGLLQDNVSPAADQSGQIKEQYQVLVTCEAEEQQAELLERLTQEGYECRSLIS
jgi:hypothetical protein